MDVVLVIAGERGRNMKLEDVVELASFDLHYPKVDKAKLEELARAKEGLLAEK